MINMHGYNMAGLKAAAGLTKDTGPYGPYVQISYCLNENKVLAEWHVNANNWVKYRDDCNIIHVCNAHTPMTMQDIADTVAARLDLIEPELLP